jgi:alpha-2-macroglobulin
MKAIKTTIRKAMFTAVALCALLSVSSRADNPYEYRPADYNQVKPAAGETVMIMPATFLREYDPVTILFTKEMNAKGSGPLDNPSPFVSIKPTHPGEYRWLDKQTIEFRPTVPWKPMQTYLVKAMGTEKRLTALLMPPVSVTPSSGSTGLDPVARVGLEFSEQVSLDVLAKLVAFEACPLPGIEQRNCVPYGAGDFTIKASERSAKNSYTYWFIFKKPIPGGLRLRTIVRLAADVTLADAKRVYFCDTRSDFTVERAGTYEYQFTLNPSGAVYDRNQALRLSQDGVIIVDFSAAPSSLSLSQVKSMLNFSPAPRAMEWSLSDTRLTVRLTVDRERMYNVSIAPIQVTDRDGRTLKLAKPCSFFCYQPRDKQYARWGTGYGLVERFGPQHFPLFVSGVKCLDFRIYKIDPLHKGFWPYPAAPVALDESALPPGPGEEPTLEEKILSPLSTWDMANHVRMLGSPQYSAVVDLDKTGVTRFQSIDLQPLFASIAGPNKPGTYLIGFRMLDGSKERSYVRVQASDLCVSSVEAKSRLLFTVTSYSTGKPVSDAEITVEGIKRDKFEPLVKGRTNGDGMLVIEHTDTLKKAFAGAVKRLVVKHDDDLLTLDCRASKAPQEFVNNHWYGSQSSWLEWLSNDRYDFRNDRRSKGFVFTERPIYRPGEAVYFKAYARTLYQGKILGPDNPCTYMVRIISPAGTQWDFQLPLSEVNSCDGVFKEKEPPTGEYQVQFLRTVPKEGQSVVATTSFSIEAYRVPKFEVRMFGPDKAPNDRPLTIKLSATYFAGGKVTGQPVAWNVVSYPFSFVPEAAAGYIMSTDNRYGAVDEERQQGVVEEKDATDDAGQSSIVVNPQSATKGNARRYVCEATVTDADEQTVSNRHVFLALPPFALGLKVDRHITGTNVIRAKIVTVGISGKFEGGHAVTVSLKKMSWTSYLQETDFSLGKPKYLTQESTDLIAEKKLTTAATPAEVTFANQEPGVFIIEVAARDRLGRLQIVKADLFLAGKKPVVWKKGEQLLFETVADKSSYSPGQQAKILVKSPFQRALAFAVIEMPSGIPDYRWIEIADGQGTLELAVTPEMAPRLPVSFLLMRPRIAKEKAIPSGALIDAGKPQTMANTTWLTVDQIDNMLKVSLDHAPVVRPGTNVDLTVGLKDGRGNPRPGEVALWLVDEAVLSLAKEKPLDPLPSFTDDIRSHITMRDSRNMAIGDLRPPETPGGDGAGGKEDLFGKVTVRKNFKTVPYWNPSVKVDKSGSAKVSFTMSDDLTNFAVRAVAVSDQDRFGVGKSQVKVRLPVIVQPALPRFVRLGDKIRAGGMARVVEGSGGPAVYTIETKGLALDGPARETPVTLDNVKPLPVMASMSVPEPGFDSLGNLAYDSASVKIAVVRRADKASDAFSVRLPIKFDRPFVEHDYFAEVNKQKPLVVPALPEKARPGTVSRQLLISDQMAILKAVSGMTALVRYPHGCTEQRVSRSYPAMAYRELWAKFGLAAPIPSVKRDVSATIEYLGRAQTQDGLFAYWPGGSGYIYLTAYVVEFLTEVKKANESSAAGYAFDEGMYAKAIDALKQGLRSDYAHWVDGYSYYERSCALFALAKAGQLDIGYARELSGRAGSLDLQSKARVYESLLKNGGALNSELKDLYKSIWNQTVFKMDNGKEVFAGLQERSFTIGARVLTGEITAMAAMVSAMSAAPKRPEKLPMVVNELVSLGGGEDWGSTQANSLSLLALRNYLDRPMGSGAYTGSILCGAAQESYSYDAKNGALVRRYADPGKVEIRLGASPKDQPCFTRFSQRYMPLEPGSRAPASQKGFVVKRTLVLIDKTKGNKVVPLDSAGIMRTIKPGDIIEEHIQVQNPKDRYYVAVSAPFAAGVEYMNPRLETSGADAVPEGATTSVGDYQAFLDDQVVYYFEHMNAGTYDFYFREKATVEGEFSHPGARAEMMYEMGTYGTSPGAKIVVVGEGK